MSNIVKLHNVIIEESFQYHGLPDTSFLGEYFFRYSIENKVTDYGYSKGISRIHLIMTIHSLPPTPQEIEIRTTVNAKMVWREDD